jgi:hypothetical protein
MRILQTLSLLVIPTRSAATRRNLLLADSFVALSGSNNVPWGT